jgi:dienelactone hydrolase
VLDPVGRGAGRSILPVDPIEAAIAAGRWAPPQEGDAVTSGREGREQQRWRGLGANEGVYADAALNGGWLYVPVLSPDDRVVLLAASSHTMVYVNGEPRAGDPYETGFVALPIQLHKGKNDLLFACGRGRLRVELKPVPAGTTVMFWSADFTTPDFVRGVPDAQSASVIVVNATTRPAHPRITAQGEPTDAEAAAGAGAGAGAAAPRRRLDVVPPMSVRKSPVTLRYRGATTNPIATSTITLYDGDAPGGDQSPTAADTIRIDCRVREPGETVKRTFVSDVDDSVQYFAIVPAAAAPHSRSAGDNGARPALVLSLHGAAVEASGQADAYGAKPWCHIVCPTNRRPYGFDWEDWGRTDAMEVLDRAQVMLQTDSSRTYLTGHSMGGHGVWQLGSLFPDRFAAIGPSAGWLSFATYATARPATTAAASSTEPATRPGSVADVFRRAALASDTTAFLTNLANRSVYILHGADDDNVPVGQARLAAKLLSQFHHDYVLFEQPRAGHWWDDSDEPGASCVDWPPMFDAFARHRLPGTDASAADVREVDFRTPNPGVSSRCHWLSIDAQVRPMVMSRALVRYDPWQQRFKGDTENVARLRLELPPWPPVKPATETRTIRITLDGAGPGAVNVDPAQHELWLYHEGETWRAGAAPPPTVKRAARTGPFKQAIANHVVFVYGTAGSEDENVATYNKARYDAEMWWYRANGAADVIADSDFTPESYAGRNVVLYGNADTNRVWPTLLRDSPIQVRRGEVRIGNERVETGEDLACVFLRPHPDSPDALVAAVGSTGPAGARLSNRLAYFTSGVGFPDWCVLGPEVLSGGVRAARGAGFFTNDWSLSPADPTWQNASQQQQEPRGAATESSR